MDYDNLYNHYENMVTNGNFHGDNFDRVDLILQVIYKIEDQSSGIFYSLETEKEKINFLEDFNNACQYLLDNPNFEDGQCAEWVIADRTGELPKILQ
jgi:hypothetical protein